jgi:hypothetical protein
MFQGQIDLDAAIAVEATAIPDVLFERGLYWASGRSGVVNLVAAHKWFNLAALKGRADAISMRREVAAMMSDAEIATAQREARAWMTGALRFDGAGVTPAACHWQGSISWPSCRSRRGMDRCVRRGRQGFLTGSFGSPNRLHGASSPSRRRRLRCRATQSSDTSTSSM